MIKIFSVKKQSSFSRDSYYVIEKPGANPKDDSPAAFNIITGDSLRRSYDAIVTHGVWNDGPFISIREAQKYIQTKGWRKYE